MARAAEISGYVGVEGRAFFEDAAFTGQHSGAVNVSLIAQPEFHQRWEDSGQSVTLVPFVRVDAQDKERTHLDVREGFWRKHTDDWQLSAGVRKVFWGTTESQHLVDIINQTDLIEDPDGEDKLGQPMVQLSLFRDFGTFDFFLLPYFRERTYPGRRGRLRTGLIVDGEQATFDSDARNTHVDWAARWSHYFGPLDIGIAHFQGTSREPRFFLGTRGGDPVLVPHYDQIDQTSVDAQVTLGSWLWKLEALNRSGQDETFQAGVGGVEYTFFNVAGRGGDLGLLMEYHYDSRGADSLSVFENDLFAGGRFAANDTQDTQFVGGIVQDLNSRTNSLYFEASRRITDHLNIEAESRLFNHVDEDDPLAPLAGDDYLQMRVNYFF
ncbi:MAG: hypothetical protein KC897_09320 [Candidatus Omnitrophica bacterium]|nr:hypothetical protein [Candidatus Omnitrophota bacterium]